MAACCLSRNIIVFFLSSVRGSPEPPSSSVPSERTMISVDYYLIGCFCFSPSFLLSERFASNKPGSRYITKGPIRCEIQLWIRRGWSISATVIRRVRLLLVGLSCPLLYRFISAGKCSFEVVYQPVPRLAHKLL